MSVLIPLVFCGIGVCIGALAGSPRLRRHLRRVEPLPHQEEPAHNSSVENAVLIEKVDLKEIPAGYCRRHGTGIAHLPQLISVALTRATNPSGFYSVTFAPDVLDALRTGDATLMHSSVGERAIAVSAHSGRVRGNGILVQSRETVERACFQMASVVVGQYFLGRIDSKLSAILSETEDIEKPLIARNRAELQLALEFLDAIYRRPNLDGLFASDLADVREHRRACQEIAASKLIIVMDTIYAPRRREAVGMDEVAREKVGRASAWLNDKVSSLNTSGTEGSLIKEVTAIATDMNSGLLASQALLCFEALLQPNGRSLGAQLTNKMIGEYVSAWKMLSGVFELRQAKSLKDWRMFNADDKRARLKRELEALLEPIEQNIKTLTYLAEKWKESSTAVPETLYVSVDGGSREATLYVPDRSRSI